MKTLILVLSVGAAVSAQAITPAQLGQELAQLLSTYVPVELFHQHAVLWKLTSGEPPSSEAAQAALKAVGARLKRLRSVISEDSLWIPLLPTLQTASRVLTGATEALAGTAIEELAPEDQEALLETLTQARKALDGLVLAGAEAAEAAGGGWEFQAAFLAKTVLLSPSPLYLNIPEEWQAYLWRNLPPDFPAEGVQALDGLLKLANRGLTESEQEGARRMAEELLRLLVEGGA